MMRKLPRLVTYVMKWTAVGVIAGWMLLAMLLLFDTGGLGTLLRHAQAPFVVLYILGMSFAVTGGMAAVASVILLKHGLGGEGGGDSRLERWKAGGSAMVDDDKPP